MAKECILEVRDEVNVRFHGLDVSTRRKLVDKLKFFIPHARHTPAYRLGRWDGTISFCDIGARTYINLITDLIPIIQQSGYEITIDDKRIQYDFLFDQVDEQSYSHVVWPAGHPMAGKPIVLREHQVEMINSYLETYQSINICPTAGGKAQPLYSKIKTPTGWTTMGEIKAGDLVSTPCGQSASVVGIYPQGKKDIYEFTFADGRTARSTDEHLWKVYNKHFAGKEGRWRVWDTNKIIEWFDGGENRTLHVPLPEPDKSCEDKELPLDPWLLGFLIGDGSFRNGCPKFSSADTELVERVSLVLHDDYEVRKLAGTYDYGINIKHELYEQYRSENCFRKRFNRYREIISDLGLDDTHSHTKFIPEVYKDASYDQRLELIRGLMDSDGSAEGNAKATFCTTSEQLARDMQELLWSIGAIAKISESVPTYTYKGKKKQGKTAYTIRIKMPSPHRLFSLKRKLDKIGDTYQHENSVRLKIEKVEKVGHEEAQCIMIDSDEHLYITDNYVVTHNTIVCAVLSHKVEDYGKSVVIVPSKDLVTQTEEDYINFGLDVGVYYGDRKDLTHQHTICTWQSLESLVKKTKEGTADITIHEFLEDVICVMVDEVHKSKAAVLRKLLSGPFAHVPIRWGLTGTLPEEDHEKVAVTSCIGPAINAIKASDLQEKGYLANLDIEIWQMKDFNDVFDNYQSELKWLTSNRTRIEHISERIIDVAEENGNTLILVDRIETGKLFNEFIHNSVFIDGSVKSTDRKKEYKSIQDVNGKVIIATYGVASTGISINRLFNLVLFEPGKSFIRVIQSIGRGLRVAEDKDFVNVYDVSSTCKYSKRHLAKRKKHYKEAEYPFKVKKIEY